MPAVPTYQRRQGVPAQANAVRGDVGAAGAVGASIGKGFAEIGQIVDDLQAASRAAEKDKAITGANKELLELGFEMEQDTDFATQPQRFQERTAAIRQKYLGEIKDTQVQRLFQRDFDKVAITKEFDVRSKARKGQVQGLEADLDANLDSIVPLAVHAANPVARQTAIEQGLGRIALAAKQGVINPLEQGKREKKFLGQVDEAQVLGRLNGDEKTVNSAIAELQAGQYANLDPVQTERLIRTAQTRADSMARERVSQSEKAERQAEKTLKTRQASEEASYLSMIDANEEVSEVTLREALNRQEISAEGYRMLTSRRFQTEDGRDNNFVLTDLQERMIRGGEDIHKDIIAARNAKNLSAQTTGQLMAENQRRIQSSQSQDWRSDTERNAFQFVGTTLGRDKLAFAFDDDTAQRLALAQREFIQRVKEQNEDPWKVADDITAKYQRAQAKEPARIGYGLGQPKSIDDLRSFGQQLRQKRDDGQITPADFEREINTLRRWQDYLPTEQPKPTGK